MYAKLSKPVLHRPLLRERLFTRLDTTAGVPILWLAAPAGSGKTTLVASYLGTRAIDTHWLHLDPGDTDPATLFHGFRTLAEGVTGLRDENLPALTSDFAGNLGAFSRLFFRAFFARFDPGVALVVDDVHEAMADTLAPILREGLRELPMGIRLFLLSRHSPPPALSRLRLEGRLDIVSAEELRFTADETRALLVTRGVSEPGRAESVFTRTDGWAAGIVLLCNEPAPRGAMHGGQPETSASFAFEYFAGEVFDRLSQVERDALLRTSVAPEFDEALAVVLTGNAAAGRLFESLYRSHLFITRHGEPHAVYRLHRLFREFLVNRAQIELSADTRAQLCLGAAEGLALAGAREVAFELFVQAGRTVQAVTTVHEIADELIACGRHATLSAMLARLPLALVETEPWLLYWRAIANLWSAPVRATDDLQRARTQFQQLHLAEGECRAVVSLLEAIELGLGDFRAKDHWMAQLLKLLPPTDNTDCPEVYVRGMAMLLNTLLDRAPDHPEILGRQSALRAQLNRPDLDQEVRLLVATALAFYALQAADDTAARCAGSVGSALAESAAISPSVRCGWWNFDAWVQWGRGDILEARASFDRMYRVADEFGIKAWALTGLASAALMTTMVKEFSRAESMWAQVEGLLGEGQFMAARLHSTGRMTMEWLQGDISRAVALISPALRDVRNVGVPDVIACTLSHTVAISLAAGHLPSAGSLLEEAESTLRGSVIRYHDAALLALRTIHARDTGDPLQPEHLRRCMEALRHSGTWGSFGALHGVAASVCNLALDAGIESEVALHLIERFGLPPPEDASALWPWRIRIRALGVYDLAVPPTAERDSSRLKHRVHQLLQMVIAAGIRGVSSEKAADLLWPDAEGDAAQASLRVGLHRARRLLGEDAGLRTREGRVLINTDVCWVDVFEFETRADRYLAQAVDAAGADSLDLNRMLALYAGALLPDSNDPYISGRRDYLQAKFLRVVHRAGAHFEAARKWEKAAAVYERGLECASPNDVLRSRWTRCLEEAARQPPSSDGSGTLRAKGDLTGDDV